MLIAIVVAAVVLLAAVGGIIMALNRGGGDQPVDHDHPVPADRRRPRSRPTADRAADRPAVRGPPTRPPTRAESTDAAQRRPVDLGNGVDLTPASGWKVKKTGKGVAQLSDGKNIFLGQAIKVDAEHQPGPAVHGLAQQVAEGTSGGKFAGPEEVDLGTAKLKGATCLAQITVSSGQGSATIFLFSLVSVRQSDGVTVIGTAYFTESADADQLNKDFTTMVNSMLKGQT